MLLQYSDNCEVGMDERSARERVDGLLHKAAELGSGSLRLAVLTGGGERVVDGTALAPVVRLRAWLREAMDRHRPAEAGGRFRLRLLDAGGRAAGSAVVRLEDIAEVLGDSRPANLAVASRSAPGLASALARETPVGPHSPASHVGIAPGRAAQAETRASIAEAALAEARRRIETLERRCQDAERRVREPSAGPTAELTRLRAEVRELEEAAARASTTAGDARRELAEARAALGRAKQEVRDAADRAARTEARARELETRNAEQERVKAEVHTDRAEQHRLVERLAESLDAERQAAARAGEAEQRLAALDAEFGRYRREAEGREAALEEEAAQRKAELAALGAERERLRGVVRRQHATIDTMEAQAEVINAQVHQLFDDEGAGRSKGRRG